MRILTTSLVLLVCFHLSQSARIVLLYPFCTKSHLYVIKPAIEVLADKGHNITVFTPYKGISDGISAAREIYLSDIGRILDVYDVDWFAMEKKGFLQTFDMLLEFMEAAPEFARLFLRNEEFQRIVKERDVDLFVVDGFGSEYTYPVIDSIGVPFIASSATVVMPMLLSALGTLPEYAYSPGTTVDASNRMSFFERIQNLLVAEGTKLVRKHLIFKALDEVVREEFPNAKSIAEVEGKASLTFFNSHLAYAYPRSLPPNIIYLPAMHTRPAKVLPAEFKTFADDAKDGLIVFSLGSFISTSSMPREYVESFSNAFSKLPYKVVWKWEGKHPEGIPKNVLMAPWIPQQDLLDHPNARLLICHGGLLSTQEAIYNGIPFISLPFGNDQRTVTRKSRDEGYAIQLNWSNLSESELLDAIKYLIEEPKVQECAKKASEMLRDQMIPSVDKAVYWIESVIRHGGAQHLRLASTSLPFHKRYMLDVVGVLLVSSALVVYIFCKVLCTVLKKCRRSNGRIPTEKLKIN